MLLNLSVFRLISAYCRKVLSLLRPSKIVQGFFWCMREREQKDQRLFCGCRMMNRVPLVLASRVLLSGFYLCPHLQRLSVEGALLTQLDDLLYS